MEEQLVKFVRDGARSKYGTASLVRSRRKEAYVSEQLDCCTLC